jgi:hypothetical protein
VSAIDASSTAPSRAHADDAVASDAVASADAVEAAGTHGPTMVPMQGDCARTARMMSPMAKRMPKRVGAAPALVVYAAAALLGGVLGLLV